MQSAALALGLVAAQALHAASRPYLPYGGPPPLRELRPTASCEMTRLPPLLLEDGSAAPVIKPGWQLAGQRAADTNAATGIASAVDSTNLTASAATPTNLPSITTLLTNPPAISGLSTQAPPAEMAVAAPPQTEATPISSAINEIVVSSSAFGQPPAYSVPAPMTPQMLLPFFKPWPGASNASGGAVVMPVEFVPPVSTVRRASSATYRSE